MAKKRRNAKRKEPTSPTPSSPTDSLSEDEMFDEDAVESEGEEYVTEETDALDDGARIDEQLALMTERRSAIREHAVKKLCSILRNRHDPECYNERKMTIEDVCLRSLRKGTLPEKVYACELLGLLSLNLGEEYEDILDNVSRVLMPIITPATAAKNPNSALWGSALRVVTIMVFITATSSSTLEFLEETIDPILKAKAAFGIPYSILASAIECATFLLSSLDDNLFVETLFDHYFALFRIRLEHEDINVRMSAGIAIAYLYDARRRSSYALHDNKGERNEFERVVDMLAEMNVGSAFEKLSKKEKASKSVFRDIISSLEGDDPRISFFVKKTKVVLTSWCHNVQYRFLRSFLGGSIQVYMENSPMFHSLFEIDFRLVHTSKMQLGAGEKRKLLSTSSDVSKERTRTRDRDRRKRDQMKTSFGAEDD